MVKKNRTQAEILEDDYQWFLKKGEDPNSEMMLHIKKEAAYLRQSAAKSAALEREAKGQATPEDKYIIVMMKQMPYQP